MVEPDPNPPDSNDPPARQRDGRSIALLLSGDEQGLRDLVSRYDRLVRYAIFRTGRRYCERDPHWLDVRANEAWAAVVQSLRRGAVPENLAAYITQISRNTCIDAVRAARRRSIFSFTGEFTGESESSENSDPAEMVEYLDQLAAIRELIPGLPKEDQRILGEVGLIVERRWKDAAQRLGMAESTLRSRWEGVLERLRSGLEKK